MFKSAPIVIILVFPWVELARVWLELKLLTVMELEVPSPIAILVEGRVMSKVEWVVSVTTKEVKVTGPFCSNLMPEAVIVFSTLLIEVALFFETTISPELITLVFVIPIGATTSA